MFRNILNIAVMAAVALAMWALLDRGGLLLNAQAGDNAPAPAFTHADAKDWLNSEPLTWSDLRGKVVLVDVWTFACWNCYRSIPWMNTLYDKFPDKFEILGVHTPELPQEYKRDNVIAKVKEFKVRGPVMIDNDYSYWKALNNRYWPAFYVVDAKGRIRGKFIGETHAGDNNARRMEALIDSLLKEARS